MTRWRRIRERITGLFRRICADPYCAQNGTCRHGNRLMRGR